LNLHDRPAFHRRDVWQRRDPTLASASQTRDRGRVPDDACLALPASRGVTERTLRCRERCYLRAMRRLLVVEEAHPSGATGVVLSPRFVSEGVPPRAVSVRLKLPGGAERLTTAHVQLSHMRGPSSPFGLLRLPDLAPDDVPAGTEVWLDE
jgi:hypothetical protein